MIQASAEQLKVIRAPLAPVSVIACAGSGKTFTAVRRLAEVRRQLHQHRGRVALLSFSNIAVETFRREYQKLVENALAGPGHDRVEIDTLDAFITRNVLRPHAYRTMGAQQAAFLVMGGEAFLNGFRFNTESYPRNIAEMQVGVENGQPFFCYSDNGETRALDTRYASDIVNRLGQAGAYTHNIGRYWCYRTLAEQPPILRALARRYPHILIDEAQDVGTVHQAVVEQLVDAGCHVSLIGDPNQGIYEFAGANGAFLTQYGSRAGVSNLGLTKNHRSVPAILDLANLLSARADSADRVAPASKHGAFFVPYRNAEREELVMSFQAAVVAAELDPSRSAVLCRGRSLADKLSGVEGTLGRGTVKKLAKAAILRDRNKDYLAAFKLVAGGIVGLLEAPPKGLVASLCSPASNTIDRSLRRLVWAFARCGDSGLPDSTLTADTEWHPLLLERVRALLAVIESDHGLASVSSLGQKLSKRDLPGVPLVAATDLAVGDESQLIRVDTVHQAKGESLDAVLYLAKKEHARALLAGVDTELGRIGYVAVTRARNLFWLGVPVNALEELRPALLARGFNEASCTVKA